MNLKHNRRNNLTDLSIALAILVSCAVLTTQLATANNQTQPISSRAAFLRAQRASRQQQLQTSNTQNTEANKPISAPTSSDKPPKSTGHGSVIETSAPVAVAVAAAAASPAPATTNSATSSSSQLTSNNQSNQAPNRATRTADIFQNGDGFNIFVTNTCERELMHVNIKTSRPFYGVIHTRNQRQKSVCTVEGNGDTDYNLDISHVLNTQDPAHCGVIKARKDSPDDKDLLSVVIAVRVHRKIELPDDKFFLLNCTNRCRKPDCSTPSSSRLTNLNADGDSSGRLTNPDAETESGGERESGREPLDGADRRAKNEPGQEEECTIWKFPWVITLLWCLGILLLAMIISHCIMCSSLVCRCVKTEVEETEPSIYEGASDDEDSLYNKRNHPMRIDYDNKGVYKTSNNYEPYSLEEVQAKSRQSKKHSGKRTSPR